MGPSAALAVLLAASLIASGCGPGDEQPATPERGEAPPPSQLAVVAVDGPITHLDPLFAKSSAERFVSRQIYDPVFDRLDPPLGATGSRRGPTWPVEETATGDWVFQIRPYARFQDGADLDADAIVANSERWFASGLAARLLPELDAVDQPFPDKVRFQLSGRVPDFPARLGDPRLGLVSPGALPASPFDEVEGGLGGSGAFRPTVLTADRILLGASEAWWGRGAGLGPGVENLEVREAESPAERLRLLQEGEADIASGLEASAARPIAAQPLLIAVSQGDGLLAASAAVRGLGSNEAAQPFSEIWLTTLRRP